MNDMYKKKQEHAKTMLEFFNLHGRHIPFV